MPRSRRRCKNDFGDAITFYRIANGKVRQPPNQDWKQTSVYLTDAAATALITACGTTVAAGDPLPVSNPTYVDEMLSSERGRGGRSGMKHRAACGFWDAGPARAGLALGHARADCIVERPRCSSRRGGYA